MRLKQTMRTSFPHTKVTVIDILDIVHRCVHNTSHYLFVCFRKKALATFLIERIPTWFGPGAIVCAKTNSLLWTWISIGFLRWSRHPLEVK